MKDLTTYQNEIIIFCKSYQNDIERIKILFGSIKKHNKDNIPFYISIPKQDLELFQSELGIEGWNVIFDEDLTDQTSIQSHFTQRLFKMEFYKTKIAQYYLIIDSDMYFIRDFYKTDFVASNGIPYFTIHECKDLMELSWKIKGSGVLLEWFKAERLPLMEIFGRTGKAYDYSGSALLYISEVFKGLYEEYCVPNNLTFLDLLNTHGSENTWFGEFVLYSGLKYYPTGPMFKTFHYPEQYTLSKQLGMTEEMFAANYLGITMQSNWNSPLKY